MDLTEDLSARVLLKHILTTEPPRTPITRRYLNTIESPRTPITRSESSAQSTSTTRRSNRLANRGAGPRTPQDILRRSLSQKMRASITRKSLPSTNRRTASAVHRKTNTPAPVSMQFGDGDTPRHILMNILRTEPVRTPVVHEKAAPEEPQTISANSSITSITTKRPSIELSGLDLPDITISNAVSTAKGLSRKRPHRSLNVTAFEKRLKEGDDVEEETEEPIAAEHSSLSLSSSTSLSLKTPFVDIGTEKRGLQRRVSNRRKITEEEFGAAVIKRQMGGVSGLLERGLSETTFSEGFTLGLSNLSEPDITADIVHCNTALFAQPDAMTSNFSIVATQDKPTVMASQLQRQMIGEEKMEHIKERSLYLFPTEEGIGTEPQNEECSTLKGAVESEKEEETRPADGGPENAAAVSESEEEEGKAEPQTSERHDTTESEKEGGVDFPPEEDVVARCQSEEKEGAVVSQTEELDGVASQSEEEEGAADFQTEEGEGEGGSQTEGLGADASQSEEEEVAPDTQTVEGDVDSQTKELGAIHSQFEEEEDAEHQSEQEDPANGGLAGFQSEGEHDGKPGEDDGEQPSEQLEQDLEHVSQRAHRSEGGVMLVTEAGEDLSAAGSKYMAESSTPEDISCTEAKANKENYFHQSIEGSRDLGHNSPEEATAQDPAEQEEDWDDEEDDGEESDEVPSKTPAFVREKRSIFHSDPLASPSVLKKVAASGTSGGSPGSKPKQVKKRIRPAKKEGGLPKSYLMGVFKHFAKTKVSADVYPVLEETMDKFFGRLAEDLETYAIHAKRKTVEVEDAELLLKRQGHVNDKVPVEVLIEKYLRMDQRKLLIPIATSGNVVIPKKRR